MTNISQCCVCKAPANLSFINKTGWKSKKNKLCVPCSNHYIHCPECKGYYEVNICCPRCLRLDLIKCIKCQKICTINDITIYQKKCIHKSCLEKCYDCNALGINFSTVNNKKQEKVKVCNHCSKNYIKCTNCNILMHEDNIHSKLTCSIACANINRPRNQVYKNQYIPSLKDLFGLEIEYIGYPVQIPEFDCISDRSCGFEFSISHL